MAFIGLACKTLISEYGLDGKPLRFLLLLTSPLTFVVAFFFCLALVRRSAPAVLTSPSRH